MPPPASSGDLQSRLQAALGDTYRLEKELGGGGMSRVFLADEVRLGRKVVIKVLPPEMGAGVSVERFEREIQLAARLQHPHIVPLLTAGAAGDLLYYIMPFIEGESLRSKLAREGELPVAEVVRILREVLDALQYAHSNRVVHRDIKPDNVLLSGRHALVTDFGVAKAVSESTGESSLTSLGVALGTPAYMAPEQAAADPHVDHRADLYAVGALAYEMLTGRPPFTGPTAQAVLAAHITQAPAPATQHRATVPPALDQLILRCLAKKPADRPQRADELLPHLDALLTPSGGITPTGTQPLTAVDYHAAARRAHPVRVAALFALASVGVLAIMYLVVQRAGLPDWVFQGAIALLVAGLPIMLVTAWLERRRAQNRVTGVATTTPVGLARHATWRKALLGGVLAFTGLALAAALFMATRALGIGPAATLITAGVLQDQDRLILADFDNAAADSTVAETVTGLLRIDLAQSRAFTVLQSGQVSELLQRMRLDPAARVTAELAAEMAQREGIKAFVAGEVRSVGSGFLVSARLVEAASGRALVSSRGTAANADGLIAAVERLSRDLRQRVGESLRSIRADPPLERLTTSSRQALQLYAQAERVADLGDYDRAIALLEQAVAQDSGFAMAWRRLGMYLTNPGAGPEREARGEAALKRAFALRDRLSERERLFVEAGHANRVEGDPERAVTLYLAIVEKYPNDPTALNNLAVEYSGLGRDAEAQRALRRLIDARMAPAIAYNNLVGSLLWHGAPEAADTVLARFAERFPESQEIAMLRSNVALARQNFPAADSIARPLLGSVPQYQQFANNRSSVVAVLEGRLADASRARREALRIEAERTGMPAEERQVLAELAEVSNRAALASDPGDVARDLDRLWERNRRLTAGRRATARGYDGFIGSYIDAGRADRARALLDEFLAAQTEGDRPDRSRLVQNLELEARVLVLEGQPDPAAAKLREACSLQPSAICRDASPWLAQALDEAGQRDSALAVYERYANLQAGRPFVFWRALPAALRRTGELYEVKGDARKAVEYYGRFVELWRRADPELQPQVREARERIARLLRDAG